MKLVQLKNHRETSKPYKSVNNSIAVVKSSPITTWVRWAQFETKPLWQFLCVTLRPSVLKILTLVDRKSKPNLGTQSYTEELSQSNAGSLRVTYASTRNCLISSQRPHW